MEKLSGKSAASILSICIFFALCRTDFLSAAGTDAFAGRIAFLKDGEVWTADENGSQKRRITKTKGKVEKYLFSPTLKYLAYSMIIGHAAEPEVQEERGTTSKKAVYSIVVTDLDTGEALIEITPQSGEWIYPEEWLPGDRLLYYSVAGGEVSGFFEFDAPKGSKKEVAYGKPGTLAKTDISRDGLLLIYVSDTGQGAEYRETLHMADLKSNKDKVLISKESIVSPRISHDKQRIAFMEMKQEEGKQLGDLWIYTIKDGSSKKIPIKTDGANPGLSWSPDDKLIGIWFPPDALIVDLQNPENARRISGTDFHWTTNHRVIFEEEGSIYFYNLNTGKKELYLKNASKPAFLQAPGRETKVIELKHDRALSSMVHSAAHDSRGWISREE